METLDDNLYLKLCLVVTISNMCMPLLSQTYKWVQSSINNKKNLYYIYIAKKNNTLALCIFWNQYSQLKPLLCTHMLHVRKSSASSRFTQWSFSKVDVPNLVNYLDQTPILKGYVVRCGPTRNYILCLTNTHTKKQTNKQTMCLVKIGLHAQNMISILDLIDNAIDSPTTLGGPARHPTSPTCVGAYAKATRCPIGYKAPPPL